VSALGPREIALAQNQQQDQDGSIVAPLIAAKRLASFGAPAGARHNALPVGMNLGLGRHRSLMLHLGKLAAMAG